MFDSSIVFGGAVVGSAVCGVTGFVSGIDNPENAALFTTVGVFGGAGVGCIGGPLTIVAAPVALPAAAASWVWVRYLK